MRIFMVPLCLIIFGCSTTDPNREENEKLAHLHSDIWQMMGLSESAQKELNAFVLHVNKNIQQNEEEHPGKIEKIEVKRDPNWQKQTREQYVQKHRERFTKLGLSESTQKELFGAMEVVWRALHDPNVSAEQKAMAEKIRDMMKELPACCDDSIFERAAR